MDTVTELQELTKLYQLGQITKEEFEKQKQSIIPPVNERRVIFRRFCGFYSLCLLLVLYPSLGIFGFFVDFLSYNYNYANYTFEAFYRTRTFIFILLVFLMVLFAMIWWLYSSIVTSDFKPKYKSIGKINLLFVLQLPLLFIFSLSPDLDFALTKKVSFFDLLWLFIPFFSTGVLALAFAKGRIVFLCLCLGVFFAFSPFFVTHIFTD